MAASVVLSPSRTNAPAAGAVIEIDGNWFATTLMVTGDDVAVPLRLSYALAVSECVPAVGSLQIAVKGALEDVPIRTVPLR